MKLLEIEEYKKQIEQYANYNIDWNLLKNKSFLISGATGMIGKCLIDIIMYKNEYDNLNCTIIALGRNKEKARCITRENKYMDNKRRC